MRKFRLALVLILSAYLVYAFGFYYQVFTDSQKMNEVMQEVKNDPFKD